MNIKNETPNAFTSFLFALIALPPLFGSAWAQTTPPSQLPRFSMAGLVYEGAFRVPADPGGVSTMNFSTGAIAINPTRNSMFYIGHVYDHALIEFPLPSLGKQTSLGSLPMAGTRLQGFTKVLDRPAGGAPRGSIDMSSGMAVIGGEILIHSLIYYDALSEATASTLVFRNKANIETSPVQGYYRFANAPVAHHAGWISPIPSEWRSILGGNYITGNSSGLPIISRLSVGPSAFAFDSASIVGNSNVPSPIPAVTLLNFELAHPLAADLDNASRSNDIWTHLSGARYGLIIPGTRTYMTLGFSGGHASGVCYKCGDDCGGYCATDRKDVSQYFWLWDMNDLVAVKNGTKTPYSVRPYAYGPWKTDIRPGYQIGGGTFNPQTGIMYITLVEADNSQGEFSNPPLTLAYSFNVNAASLKGSSHGVRRSQNAWIATSHEIHSGFMRMQAYIDHAEQARIATYDLKGMRIRTLFDGPITKSQPLNFEVPVSDLAPGVYIARMTGKDFSVSQRFVLKPN